MLDTIWNIVEKPKTPVVAHLCYGTTLSTLKALKTQPDMKSDMFGDIRAAANADGVIKDGEIPFVMALPYTWTMLVNRYLSGRDVPKEFEAQVFAIAEDLEAA